MEVPQAAVTVIHKDGFLLYIVRAERTDDPWSGNIAFPGGFLKPGETAIEAAARECYEEVGIVPELGTSLGIFTSQINGTSVEAFLARGNIANAKVNSAEVQSILITPVADLKKENDTYIYDGRRIWGLTFRITESAIKAISGGQKA